MRKVLLTISYDGTDFFGWQKQNTPQVRTVQEELEHACSSLFHTEIEATGCSRTDKGVHAVGQRATIEIDSSIPTEKIPLALIPFLPEDIAVTRAEEVPEEFHCRYDTKAKTYEYRIWNARYRNPILRHYSEFVRENLDILRMQEAAKYFLGTHDFMAFCAAGGNTKTTIRTIFDFSVLKEGNMVIMTVTGNGFLYNMVRILAGTLITVGKGKLNPEEMAEIMKSRQRKKAGITASACGLVLKEIYYENNRFI